MTPGDRRGPDHGSGRDRAPEHSSDDGCAAKRSADEHAAGQGPVDEGADKECADDAGSTGRAQAGADAVGSHAMEWDTAFAALVAGLTDEADTSDFHQATGSRQEPDPYDPSDHYEPPPPPPLPRMRPVTRWALGSIALGVGILLAPVVAGIEHGTSHDIAGVMLVLGGVVTLVAQMGDRPPTDSDDGDDGAVL